MGHDTVSSDAPTSTASESRHDLLDEFHTLHPNVNLLSVIWIDICGVTRSRLVPIRSLLGQLKTDGSVTSPYTFTLPSTAADLNFPSTQAILPELLEYILDKATIVPDLTTLRVAAHDSSGIGNMAMAIASVMWRNSDPREVLKGWIEKAEKEHGLTFLAGFELEFCFMDLQEKVTPADTKQLGMHTYSITNRSRYWPVLNQILCALGDSGIHVQQLHKEYSATQFEIALPPMKPLEAVDACVFAREVIKDVAYRHGISATFYPHPYANDEEAMKTGQHFHISATPLATSQEEEKKRNVFDPDLFMGGILAHLPALCAIGMPQIDSYSRVAEGHFGVGAYVGWGDNNRDMPVRRVANNHWEVRTHDTTSNPYLFVAGVIAAGLDRKPVTVKNIESKLQCFVEILTFRVPSAESSCPSCDPRSRKIRTPVNPRPISDFYRIHSLPVPGRKNRIRTHKTSSTYLARCPRRTGGRCGMGKGHDGRFPI